MCSMKLAHVLDEASWRMCSMKVAHVLDEAGAFEMKLAH